MSKIGKDQIDPKLIAELSSGAGSKTYHGPVEPVDAPIGAMWLDTSPRQPAVLNSEQRKL